MRRAPAPIGTSAPVPGVPVLIPRTLFPGLGVGVVAGVGEALALGDSEGLAEGDSEGLGEGVAEAVGRMLGLGLGDGEALAEGDSEGLGEGDSDGLADGDAEGLEEGDALGDSEGLGVGHCSPSAEAWGLLSTGSQPVGVGVGHCSPSAEAWGLLSAGSQELGDGDAAAGAFPGVPAWTAVPPIEKTTPNRSKAALAAAIPNLWAFVLRRRIWHRAALFRGLPPSMSNPSSRLPAPDIIGRV